MEGGGEVGRGGEFRGNGAPHEGHIPCQSRHPVMSLSGCESHCLHTTATYIHEDYSSAIYISRRKHCTNFPLGGGCGSVRTLVISSISTLSGEVFQGSGGGNIWTLDSAITWNSHRDSGRWVGCCEIGQRIIHKPRNTCNYHYYRQISIRRTWPSSQCVASISKGVQ